MIIAVLCLYYHAPRLHLAVQGIRRNRADRRILPCAPAPCRTFRIDQRIPRHGPAYRTDGGLLCIVAILRSGLHLNISVFCRRRILTPVAPLRVKYVPFDLCTFYPGICACGIVVFVQSDHIYPGDRTVCGAVQLYGSRRLRIACTQRNILCPDCLCRSGGCLDLQNDPSAHILIRTAVQLHIRLIILAGTVGHAGHGKLLHIDRKIAVLPCISGIERHISFYLCIILALTGRFHTPAGKHITCGRPCRHIRRLGAFLPQNLLIGNGHAILITKPDRIGFFLVKRRNDPVLCDICTASVPSLKIVALSGRRPWRCHGTSIRNGIGLAQRRAVIIFKYDLYIRHRPNGYPCTVRACAKTVARGNLKAVVALPIQFHSRRCRRNRLRILQNAVFVHIQYILLCIGNAAPAKQCRIPHSQAVRTVFPCKLRHRRLCDHNGARLRLAVRTACCGPIITNRCSSCQPERVRVDIPSDAIQRIPDLRAGLAAFQCHNNAGRILRSTKGRRNAPAHREGLRNRRAGAQTVFHCKSADGMRTGRFHRDSLRIFLVGSFIQRVPDFRPGYGRNTDLLAPRSISD